VPQDGLNPIVQKMIDAGESEENIATVIKHYKAQAVPQVSALDMVSGKVGRDTGETPAAPDWKSNLAGALEPMAHPQTAGDFAGLLLPGEAGTAVMNKIVSPAVAGVKKYGGAVAEFGTSLLPTKAKAALGVLKTLSPTEWNSPLTVAGREGRAVAASQRFNELPLAKQMERLPTTGPIPEARAGIPPMQPQTPFNERPLYQQMQDLTEAPSPSSMRGPSPPIRNLGNEAPLPPPPGPTGPHLDRSMPMRPSEMTQQQLLERIQSGTGTPPPPAAKPPLGGRLMTQPPPDAAVPPVTSPRPTAPPPQQLPQTPPPPPPLAAESPMQQPRTQVGAEVVGRQNGMTTQQVRDTTGPIRGEAPGTAAGMPVAPRDRMIQKLIDMGPKGQGLPELEREAYAAAGRDPKTRLQVQAWLDALRKVGYAVPIGAAAGMQRDSIMRMMSSHDPQ